MTPELLIFKYWVRGDIEHYTAIEEVMGRLIEQGHLWTVINGWLERMEVEA